VLKRVSVASSIGVLIYESAGCIYVLVQLADATSNEIALVVHLVLRISGIAAAGYAAWNLRERKTDAPGIGGF
jgi:hypothetical protein